MSLISLLLLGLVLVFGAMVVTEVFPTVTEYAAVKRAVERAQREGADPQGIRSSFERAMTIDGITSLQSNDLKIVPRPDGNYTVGFAYEKRFPLFGPAVLLLDYRGEARGAEDRASGAR